MTSFTLARSNSGARAGADVGKHISAAKMQRHFMHFAQYGGAGHAMNGNDHAPEPSTTTLPMNTDCGTSNIMTLCREISSSLIKHGLWLPLAFLTGSPASAQTQGDDIFIGTLAVERGQVFLDRCAIGDPRFVLRDDPETGGDPLEAVRESSKGAYAEVAGVYVEEKGRHALLVRHIGNVTPGRNCHLSAALDQGEASHGAATPPAVNHPARMEPLLPDPANDASKCTAAGDWCATLDEHGDQGAAITISRRDKPDLVARIPVPALSASTGFDHTLVSIWPVLMRLTGGGALIGMISEERTMYSGGGASASTLTLYRLLPGSAPAIVMELPWEASSMIRACFSERDFRQRAGACHDEYKFEAQLSIAHAGSSDMPVLRYETKATSFPGAVSRSADSLAARPLKRRDLVHVTDDNCSVTRLFHFDAAKGRYIPDTPLPDCADYTDL